MPTNDILIRAKPQTVFDVLTDPTSYGSWVVGAKRIRGHDRSWPRRGSRFKHAIGVGPVELHDESTVLEIERNRRLVLEAKFRPFGTATVELELKPVRRGKSTRVKMREKARGGPVRFVWGPFTEVLLYGRNKIALRRLKRMAEARAAC